jgi:DNA-binding IclR family transcriptional regulator
VAGNSGRPGLKVSSKTAAILLALTTGGEHTLSALADHTRLPVSTVYRLLHDLASSPVVERTADGRYRPGPALRGLALTPDPPTLDTRGPLALHDLATALQLTVRLGVPKNGDVAYIEKTPDLVPGTSFPNRARLPVHATALGKALLAYAPAVVVQRLAAGGLARFTEYTPTSISELGRAVVHARLHGFATSDRELNLDVRGVAAPVLGTGGVATAAIEVHVPDLDPSTLARVTPALILAARALARELAPMTYRFDATTPGAGIHPRHSPPEVGRPHGPARAQRTHPAAWTPRQDVPADDTGRRRGAGRPG